MGLFSKIFSSGITAPIDALGNMADKLFTSDEERLKAKAEIETIRQKPYLMQIMTNLTEAAHRSIFVAGWRPAIGWTGAAALFTYYIPKNVMAAYLWFKQCLHAIDKAEVAGKLLTLKLPAYPVGLDDTLLELIFGLLGIAAMRTVEKFGGKTK